MQEHLGATAEETVLGPVAETENLQSVSLKLPLRPSSAYLAVTRSPSNRTSVPRAPRKLLILDLNGTLLLRPKPRNARNRAVHPRPYMPTFRSYLFNDAVKSWLEVMVWSSAQPHSVNDMVDCCFKDRRDELKAVWARDTLGLDTSDYSRKVQTTKDLEKTWSARPFLAPDWQYSALTTLLLDDSPLKAHLQPYNHFCVPEYTQNIRNRDLNIKARIALHENLLEETQVEAQMQLEFPSLAPHSIRKKRKSKKRKDQGDIRDLAGFDQTLLAVTGVLDEIREQSNVAGWIRAGGLWADRAPSPRSASSSFELFSDDGRDTSGNPSDISTSNSVLHSRSIPELVTVQANPGNDAVLVEESMWFDHAPCFQYWVERGRRALGSLGIELDHGIDR